MHTINCCLQRKTIFLFFIFRLLFVFSCSRWYCFAFCGVCKGRWLRIGKKFFSKFIIDQGKSIVNCYSVPIICTLKKWWTNEKDEKKDEKKERKKKGEEQEQEKELMIFSLLCLVQVALEHTFLCISRIASRSEDAISAKSVQRKTRTRLHSEMQTLSARSAAERAKLYADSF